MSIIFGTAMFVLAVFLILLVLVQRGRGGGLSGALGGMGGSSAFGAKAGDVFTRITVVTVAIWIAVCVAAVYWSNHRGDVFGEVEASFGPPGPAASQPAEQPAAPAGDAQDTGTADEQ